MEKSESKIQQECFEWYWNNYCSELCSPREIIFHVPNQNQHKLLNIGVVPGVSDLVATYRGSTLFLEVKTKDGKQSKNQVKIQRHIEGVQSTEYFILRSVDEFKKIIHDKIMRRVIRLVAIYSNKSINDIMSKSRRLELVSLRSLASKAMRKKGIKIVHIAQFFNMDHTSILNILEKEYFDDEALGNILEMI